MRSPNQARATCTSQCFLAFAEPGRTGEPPPLLLPEFFRNLKQAPSKGRATGLRAANGTISMNQNPFTQRLLDSPLATVADFYAQHFNENAHNFLTNNCLSADSVLRVGFTDRSLGKQIPDKQLKLGHEIRTKLKQVRIIKANGRETLRSFAVWTATRSAV